MTTFINLRLILEKIGETRYRAKLEHETQPNPQSIEFSFALTDIISDNRSFNYYFVERLGELRAREDELEIVGKALYNLIFREDLGATFQAWYRGLPRDERFRLRLDIQAPELVGIPWELLRDDQQFLVRRGVSIVRFIDNARKDDVNLDSKNIKVLIVSASPTNNSFNENEYIQPIEEFFQQYGIQPDILRGKQATRSDLQKILYKNKYDLFHFVGHGTFAKDNGKVWVLNQEGDPESIRGNDLSDWLWDSGVKFAFFCSCQTGITSQENTFNGVAHSLVGRGIPTVVAMQYNFPQQEAKVFVESFYDKLLRSENIDEAMRFARNRLPHGEVSWCIPVLYSQFNIGKLITNPQPPTPPDTEDRSLLTKSDISELTRLLVAGKCAKPDQREQLCKDIDIDANDVDYINNPNNNTFAKSLLDYLYELYELGDTTSIILLCEKLQKIRICITGDNGKILLDIRTKLGSTRVG